jgi:thioredoxin-like negative regulator of GroEL
LETRFTKINAEKAPFLVERLGILLMPTIVLIKDGKTEHSILGFDEFGGVDDFSTEDMAYVLSTHGVLNFEIDKSETIRENMSRKSGVNAIGVSCIRSSDYYSLDDDVEDI